MTCTAREQEIWLLAHGELSAWRAWRLRAHLRRCPDCQARYTRVGQVSLAIAGVVRGPERAAWSPALNRTGRGLKPRWPFALAILFLLLAGIVLYHAFPLFATTGPSAASRSQGDCAPGLPNDHCR